MASLQIYWCLLSKNVVEVKYNLKSYVLKSGETENQEFAINLNIFFFIGLTKNKILNTKYWVSVDFFVVVSIQNK